MHAGHREIFTIGLCATCMHTWQAHVSACTNSQTPCNTMSQTMQEPNPDAWRERQEREAAAWQAYNSTSAMLSQRHWLLQKSFEAEEGLMFQRLVQSRLDEAWKLHPCCQKTAGFDSSMVHIVSRTEVDVVFLGLARGRVSVPSWFCAGCKSTCCASPITANCFPASPSSATLWFHRPVMELYKQLGLRNGMSLTGTHAWQTCIMAVCNLA